MTPTIVGVLAIAGLFLLIFLRVPIGVALAIAGVSGYYVLSGLDPTLALLGSIPFEIAYNYDLSIIALFVLMGNYAMVSGMSRDLYDLARSLVGHWPGGLASATVIGCAGFAAVSGSSLASAVTMGRVALPEMRRYDYDPRLATGCIAAGGTLGILIPPSTGFVIYAILTEESIGRLFLAGVLPGLLLTSLFMAAIAIQTRLDPKLGPPGPVVSFADKVRATSKSSAMIGIVVITIGGIYSGFFTAGEAAGVGAFLAFILAIRRRAVNRTSLTFTLLQTVRTTAFAFLILIGAHVFNPFLALTQIPADLAQALIGTNLPPHGILLILLVSFIVLGTFLEGFAILVLTLPIVHPLIVTLGFDPIWFGVVMVIVLEMGLISPPVGVNVFVVKSIAGDVPMGHIFVGIMPFWLAMGVCLLTLVLFPEIATFLPDRMFN